MDISSNKEWNITWENLDMVVKGKPLERNWIYSDSSCKYHHEDYVKAQLDKTRQNSRSRLWGDKDKTINHIISECTNLAPKVYKTRYEWVDKEIYWLLSKKLKFYHTNKWYMIVSGSVMDNETHTFPWNFEIQTDQLIHTEWYSSKTKKTYWIVDFVVSADHKVKLKENKKRDEGDGNTTYNCYAWNYF